MLSNQKNLFFQFITFPLPSLSSFLSFFITVAYLLYVWEASPASGLHAGAFPSSLGDGTQWYDLHVGPVGTLPKVMIPFALMRAAVMPRNAQDYIKITYMMQARFEELQCGGPAGAFVQPLSHAKEGKGSFMLEYFAAEGPKHAKEYSMNARAL